MVTRKKSGKFVAWGQIKAGKSTVSSVGTLVRKSRKASGKGYDIVSITAHASPRRSVGRRGLAPKRRFVKIGRKK